MSDQTGSTPGVSSETTVNPTDDPRQTLTGHEVEAALLSDWRIMFDTLQARFSTGDFATGLRLVNAIGEAAEAANHHPDVDLRYPWVHVRLSSHDVGGITIRDLDLAREISRAAAGVHAEAQTSAVQVLELALDTHDAAEIRPFWAALLGLSLDDGRPDEVVDTAGHLPAIWFQESERAEGGQAPSQTWHLDVRVPPEHAEARVRAALEAGGTMVSDARAPSFWVLADAQGHQACVTTWVGRAVSPDELPDGSDGSDESEQPDGSSEPDASGDE